MNQHRRHTLLSVVSLSRLLLICITASPIIVASSGASRMTRQMPQKAAVAETVMADSSVVTTAGTSSTNVQRGLGRNLQEAAKGDVYIGGQQFGSQIIVNEGGEENETVGNDIQNEQDVTETLSADNNDEPLTNDANSLTNNDEGEEPITVNNEAPVKDIVDTLKKSAVVRTENKSIGQHNAAALNNVMQNIQEGVQTDRSNADGGSVLIVDNELQQLPRQGGSPVPKPQVIHEQDTNHNGDKNEEGSPDNVIQQPLAAPPHNEPNENNKNPESRKPINNTPVEQKLRESVSSAANKLQGGQRGTIIQPQQPPQQQGGQALSRREKLEFELKEARRSPQNPISVATETEEVVESRTPQQNPISSAKEMPIPIIVDEEAAESQQQQQQKDVAQSGLRGGDAQRGAVQPQPNEEVPPPIKEMPIPEEQVQEQEGERPLPFHHQSALEKGRANNQPSAEEMIPEPAKVETVGADDPSPSVKEVIPEQAVVESVEQKPLPPQQPLQQQPQKPLPNTSSLQNLPDAVKNTMMEMEQQDLEEGKERGYHYKELMEQKKREADLRRQKLTVGGGGNPGNFVRPPPQAFRIDDPDSAQKFAEYIAKQKKGIIRKEKIRHPIQAIVGGGGSNNGSVRTKESSPMKNYKAQVNHKKSNQKMPDLRPEAQPKKRVGQKILGKIPLLKKTVKRSHAFETLNDAALSFTRGLQMGVFRNNNHALDKKRKAALLNWLDLLSISLPPELGLHELIDTLKINMDLIAQSPYELKVLIDKHPIPDGQYSKSCNKGIGQTGFFCGFWKLLHVASVGFAEQQGGLMLRELHPNIRVFSPKEAGSVLREYMGMFFNCDKCSKRFIANYDECALQSCNRLTDETVDAPAESWAEFPLWLWEVHNDVSRSKAEREADFHEKYNRKAVAKKWERLMGAVYPHLDQCLSCWTADGTWDVDAIYNHLEKEYWTFGVEVDSNTQLLLDHRDANADGVAHGLGAYLGLGIVVLLTYFLKKYKIRASGRHKKDDENLFPRASGDGRIKYRDS